MEHFQGTLFTYSLSKHLLKLHKIKYNMLGPWDSDISIFSVWGAHLPVGETDQVAHNDNTVEQAPS